MDGLEQGTWILNFESGARCEGDYVDGKKQGRWTEDLSNGDLEMGDFAEGKKTGRWSLIRKDGTSLEILFQDDKVIEKLLSVSIQL